jgi:hypothetical protein
MCVAKGIKLKNESTIKTILYTDGQVLVITSEDKLQTAAYQLNITAKKKNLKISISKTKSMRICGNEIQRLKIVTEGKSTEQVTEFNYPGNKISQYRHGI